MPRNAFHEVARAIARGTVGVACILAATQVRAGDGSATGQFESRNWKVPIADAYAFRHEASLGEGKAIWVAVSNGVFGKEYLDACWDRQYLLDNFFADDETRVVYLEFGPTGSYSGYSYYFGSGDGCGFCGGGDVTSTVKLAAGRLAGKVATKGEDVSFDISIDVTIATDDHGTDQGPGGGEPGKAYLAYHAALLAGDVAALKVRLTAARVERWQKAEQDGKGDAFLAYLGENRPQTARVERAFVSGDRALVLVTGESETYGAMHGEAQLRLEGGIWKVDDETIQIGEP